MRRLLLAATAALTLAAPAWTATAQAQPCIVDCLPCTDGSCWHIDPPDGPFVGCFRTPDTIFCI